MRRTLKLDLPSTDEIAAGLEQLQCSPALSMAEEQLASSEAALEDKQRRLDEATKAADEFPAKVHAGEATEDDLQKALLAREATAAMLPYLEKDLETAQAALLEAKRQARAAVVEEARRRRDRLQATINKDIVPVLDHLRELERALQAALEANAPEPLGDPVEASKALKLAPPVAAVGWPVSIATENRINAGKLTGVPREDGRVLS